MSPNRRQINGMINTPFDRNRFVVHRKEIAHDRNMVTLLQTNYKEGQS